MEAERAEEEKENSVLRRVWNNKRRSSLYNLQDSVGLRYRKVDGGRAIKRPLLVETSICRGNEEESKGVPADQSVPADSASSRQKKRKTPRREKTVNTSSVDNSSFKQRERKPPTREITVELSVSPEDKKSSPEGLSEDESHDTAATECSDNEEELKKQAMAISQCDHFFEQLKEEFASNTGEEDQNEIHSQLTRLQEEVKVSGLFRRAMDEPEIVPHPLEESTQQAVARLEQNIQKYDQEMDGWTALFERKQEELRTGQSSSLPEIDNAFLEQHLTDEHWKLLQETIDTDSYSAFLGKVEQQLDEIEESLDREVQAIVMEKKDLEDKLSVEQSRCVAMLLPPETPRALVRDIKHHVVASPGQS